MKIFGLRSMETKVIGAEIKIISAEGEAGELRQGDIIVFLDGKWLVNPGRSKDLPNGTIGYHLIDGKPVTQKWVSKSGWDVPLEPGIWVEPDSCVGLWVRSKKDQNCVYPVITDDAMVKMGDPKGYEPLGMNFMRKVGGDHVAINNDGSMVVAFHGYAV